MLEHQRVHRRVVIDAHQHERRVEAQRANGAGGHAVIQAGVVARREDGDTRREPPEDRAKGLGVDHLAASATRPFRDGTTGTVRDVGPNTFHKYDSLTTSRAGTKSPVTPMSKSARSFRAARLRAARLMSDGRATTAPTTRSTNHLPAISRRRDLSYAASSRSAREAVGALSAAQSLGASISPPRSAE